MTLLVVGNAVVGAILTFTLQMSSAHVQSDATLQNSQTKSYPVIELEKYNRVLDILFSRQQPASRGSLWTIVLRFRPSSKPESQIIIRRDVDRNLGVEVIEYTSPDGSIYDQLNKALERGGKDDVTQTAKSIRVARRKLNVADAKAQDWYAAFFDNLASTTKVLRRALEKADKTGAESLVLHGAVYDLWYEQGINQMSFSFYDVDVDNRHSDGESMLVRWMNAVRKDVEKQK